MLQQPEPVIVIDLLPEVLDELLKLLSVLPPEDWQKATVCSGWTVKDVALHLLGGEVGNLSRRRDGHVLGASINSWEALVAFLNEWNQGWVDAAQRISPRLLIDLLGHTGRQLNDYFRTLDPYVMGSPVGWAGPQPAPVWLDIAREYTERWHHQQHIRDAVNRPGLKEPKYLAPVLAAFVWAMPRAFEGAGAAENTCVTLTITGEAGGQWSARREGGAWRLYCGAPEGPDAEVVIEEDVAWRLFTRGLSEDGMRAGMAVKGDAALGWKVLEMVSIIA